MYNNNDLLDFYLGSGKRRSAPVQQRRRAPSQRRVANDAMDGVVTLAKTTMVLGFAAGMAGMIASAAQQH